MSLQFQSLLLIAQKDTSQALNLLKESTKLFDTLPYEDGVPIPSKPPHELLADILLQRGDSSGAVQEYQQSLLTQPHRSTTLAGLVQAARKSGDFELCKKTLTELKGNWEEADIEVKNWLASLEC